MDGNTPLTLSYEKGYLKIFKYLVEYLDINQKDSQGNSPLIYAIQSGYISIIKLLIKNGANVNIKNNKGNSPLIYAIQTDNLAIVKLLTESGSDVHIKNNDGNSPLEYAINADNYEITDYLYCYMDMLLKSIVFKKSLIKCNNDLKNTINNSILRNNNFKNAFPKNI
ncbi:ankyrin [Anaeromyces robustus]|uniref:Ankyrin n=1 Tax=Anaeromyces robustus TaxID=1754192 RepID=A0A1Y1XNX7_9FUNG|nr:ankyrin [Anaeromyces robustus]|eukprot:ORX87448.1 ankyrin [Anaeromyces robustus]